MRSLSVAVLSDATNVGPLPLSLGTTCFRGTVPVRWVHVSDVCFLGSISDHAPGSSWCVWSPVPHLVQETAKVLLESDLIWNQRAWNPTYKALHGIASKIIKGHKECFRAPNVSRRTRQCGLRQIPFLMQGWGHPWDCNCVGSLKLNSFSLPASYRKLNPAELELTFVSSVIWYWVAQKSPVLERSTVSEDLGDLLR